MNQTQYKVADSKREEFRKYLEKAGVLDTLTKVSLYEEPEKPTNALDYLGQFINSSPPQTADVEELKLSLEQLKLQNEQLSQENQDLKERQAES